MNGFEFRNLRKLAGLTQTEVAEAIGHTPQSLSKWESHKDKEINIHAKYWIKLAELFRCSTDDFLPKGRSEIQSERNSDEASEANDINAKTVSRDTLRLSAKEAQVILTARKYGSAGVLLLDQILEKANDMNLIIRRKI